MNLEMAELLDTTTASVNSAPQRARAAVANAPIAAPTPVLSAHEQHLLARYVDAFERYDMEALASLLHHDDWQPLLTSRLRFGSWLRSTVFLSGRPILPPHGSSTWLLWLGQWCRAQIADRGPSGVRPGSVPLISRPRPRASQLGDPT